MASEFVKIYYMYALNGTATPSFDEVFEKGPPSMLTTNSKYDSILVDSNF